LPEAATADCWHEAKHAAVYTPIHQFEFTLIRALDQIGVRVHPQPGALWDAVDGLGTRGEPDDSAMSYAPGLYESRRATVCVPPSPGVEARCFGGGAVEGTDAASRAAAAAMTAEQGGGAAALLEALRTMPDTSAPLADEEGSSAGGSKSEAGSEAAAPAPADFDDAQSGVDSVEEPPAPVVAQPSPEPAAPIARVQPAAEKTPSQPSVASFLKRRKAKSSG
jgi:hypothetical protein